MHTSVTIPSRVAGSIRGRLPASGSPFGLPSLTSKRRTKSIRLDGSQKGVSFKDSHGCVAVSIGFLLNLSYRSCMSDDAAFTVGATLRAGGKTQGQTAPA